MELTKKELELLDRSFEIHNSNDCYELEEWTDGGVDMIITLSKEDNRFSSMLEQFRYYVDSFNIDEEIDIYRQDKGYCENFTCRESVKDFEAWEEYIENVLKEWESL